MQRSLAITRNPSILTTTNDAMRSVLPKIVQAPGIEDECLKAFETICKIICEGSKPLAEDILPLTKSSILTVLEYRE